ncbi:hypothetical protein IRJ34_17780 [Paenarthrobacter sp. GOM3]|uniref:hypothetical protein n=1 Tax=Paenarthrobacter sp. GOM3 TaxID=2782567 RepID=UPI001BABF414|nr:hypothetical protein [Paenarthrobacter sp. GOM3]WOH18182.1 hypothetical protein IRJ34_17780 [Paenarthrobacter sp. GOM3]
MTPDALGALQPTRFSASRTLVTKMVQERWVISRAEFDIDASGQGNARYHVAVNDDWSFEFVVFSNAPKEGVERTDRIIGSHWDMMGALIEGAAGDERIEQTKRELPKLYGGRAAPGTLIWCRANRSMRAFDLTVEALSRGEQPPARVLGAVCYLMRNTGLDGNGTFGTRSFAAYESDHPLRTPYHAQMLTSYLMREFSLDLAEHMAAAQSPAAAVLSHDFRRFLGLGNASGLGLVLFAKNHPQMVDRWITLRESSLAEARDLILAADAPELDRLDSLLERAVSYKAEDRMRYTYQPAAQLVSSELAELRSTLATLRASGSEPDYLLDVLYRASTKLTSETQEILCALLLELLPAPEDMPSLITVEEHAPASPATTVSELLKIIAKDYVWATDVDLDNPAALHFAWYKSANAEEPRRGPLKDLPQVFDDMTLDLPQKLQQLLPLLRAVAPDTTAGSIMRTFPNYRSTIERLLALRNTGYHTVRANTRDQDFNPAHIIRLFNSAFYGLDKTKEDGPVGVVGVMFHGAPTPAEIADGTGQDWLFPAEPKD